MHQTPDLCFLVESAQLSNPHTPKPRFAQRAKAPKKLPPWKVAQIIDAYESGKTINEIAIHRRTVSTHLDRRGIAKRAKGMTNYEIDKAASDYQRGDSLATIGLRLGFHASTIQAALRQRGVCLRDPHGHPH